MDDREFFQYQRETNAEMFNHGHGYIQGLVVVAYAGFFVLWDQAKDIANPGVWVLAGLLLTVSLGFYTAWEAFAFLFRQRLMMKMAQAITAGEAVPSKEAYLAAARAMRVGLQQFVRNFRTWWRAAMFCILAPLLAAWILIVSAFVIRLVRLLVAWIA
ncbi:hypothetical protein [Pseudoxanthomonas japonensis]|uniref:hypothetical protein n=1 Tax=Pseudoxanthomonas japonensis TaxID=69284 RepID=UPI001BCD44D7|nr:hypothetical protein [Pseudoxanthomonas japonensis]